MIGDVGAAVRRLHLEGGAEVALALADQRRPSA